MGRTIKQFSQIDIEKFKEGGSFLEDVLKEKETGQIQIPCWAVEGLIQGLVRKLGIKNAKLATNRLVEYAKALCVLVKQFPSQNLHDLEIYNQKVLADEVPFILKKAELEFDHPIEILRQQANWISKNAFVDYPFRKHNDDSRLQWIDEHFPRVLEGLFVFTHSIEETLGEQCSENCPRRLDSPQGKKRSALGSITNPGELRNAVLGYFHGRTPETVKKSLAGRRSRSKRVT